MSSKLKRIVELNLDRSAAPKNYEFTFEGIKVKVESHFIGSRKRLAERIIFNYEGENVDFVLTSRDKSNVKKLSATPSRNMIYRGRVLDNLCNDEAQKLIKIKSRIKAASTLPETFYLTNSMAEMLLDLDRNENEPEATLETYSQKIIDKDKEKPSVEEEESTKVVRCGFILHPLAFNYLTSFPPLRPLKLAPKSVQDVLEKNISGLPGIKVGEISNVKSDFNGTEVICDIYGVWATPKEFSVMPPEKAYKILERTVDKAKRKGAVICGLGAFTKVVGDSGVSVHKLSDIPVTTGNSLSAAATLWSARVMVDKMGLIERDREGRWHGQAMVVGATGSIGKTCSKVLAAACKTLVLVAPNQSKLENLKREIEQIDSTVEIICSTNSNEYLADSDVVITATSVYEGAIFDVEQLKPGALVVECSRPLNLTKDDLKTRPDVLVINSGEVIMPGHNQKQNIELRLPKGTVYACLAETVLLALEGLYEPFSLSRDIPWKRVKQVYRMAIKHGVKLAPIDSLEGFVSEEKINSVVEAAKTKGEN